MFNGDKQDQTRINCRLGIRSKTIVRSSHLEIDQEKLINKFIKKSINRSSVFSVKQDTFFGSST